MSLASTKQADQRLILAALATALATSSILAGCVTRGSGAGQTRADRPWHTHASAASRPLIVVGNGACFLVPSSGQLKCTDAPRIESAVSQSGSRPLDAVSWGPLGACVLFEDGQVRCFREWTDDVAISEVMAGCEALSGASDSFVCCSEGITACARIPGPYFDDDVSLAGCQPGEIAAEIASIGTNGEDLAMLRLAATNTVCAIRTSRPTEVWCVGDDPYHGGCLREWTLRAESDTALVDYSLQPGVICTLASGANRVECFGSVKSRLFAPTGLRTIRLAADVGGNRPTAGSIEVGSHRGSGCVLRDAVLECWGALPRVPVQLWHFGTEMCRREDFATYPSEPWPPHINSTIVSLDVADFAMDPCTICTLQTDGTVSCSTLGQ